MGYSENVGNPWSSLPYEDSSGLVTASEQDSGSIASIQGGSALFLKEENLHSSVAFSMENVPSKIQKAHQKGIDKAKSNKRNGTK